MPGIIFTNEYGQEIEDITEGSEAGLRIVQGLDDSDTQVSNEYNSDSEPVDDLGPEYIAGADWVDGEGPREEWESGGPEPVDDSGFPIQSIATEQSEEIDVAAGLVNWVSEDQAIYDQKKPENKGDDAAGNVGSVSECTVRDLGEGEDIFYSDSDSSVQDCSGVSGLPKECPGLDDTFEKVNTTDLFENDSACQPCDPPIQDSDCRLTEGQGADIPCDSCTENIGGWVSDPWAADKNPIWPDNWEPTISNEDWGFPSHSEGQANGFERWPTFPDTPGDKEGINSSPWQEISDSSGFWSTDGLGDFGTGWGDGDQNVDILTMRSTCEEMEGSISVEVGKDQSKAPGHFENENSRNASIESSSSHKDNETNSSDLSEDEVANRRYGLLYHEIDAEKEELDAGVSAFTSDSNQSVFDAMKPEVEASAAALDTTTPEPVSEPSQEVTAAEHSEPAEKPVEITEAEVKEPTVSVEAEPAEISAVDETESPSANPLETSTTDDTEKESPTTQALNVKPELEETNKEVTEDTKAKQEKMTIPSVVIEPASNNEGEEEEDLHGETVIEEEVSAASESKVSDSTESPPTIKETAAPSQAPEDSQQSTETAAPPAAAAPEPAIETKTEPASASGLPPNFLFKVETLHDFESANSDELDLKKGDVVLVIPSEAAEDQEAGWLTGIKESDWQQNADITHKGLFPENFTQRID
ncbi:amphiphysin isoform X7 [Amia ocellicauda]|uniref:amphiphysin isoform X7 n=1 Tax=Amia ocellicauda TaxID=2972642 RepID=UPI003463CF4B